MKKIKITTPENIEVEYTLADLGSRVGAAAIDLLIQTIIFVLIGISILVVFLVSPEFWSEYYGWIIGIALILFFLVQFGYFILLELNTNGRTIGKKVLKIRTIRMNGQSITIGHSVIRNLFRVFIDSMGFGVVFIFFNKQRRRIGDMVASTIVVAEGTKTRPITLDSLEKVDENFSYYMSKEEYELIREYLERKKTMEDYSQLREELKTYFIRKFETQGNLSSWQHFIDSL
jgi:uncharacterized RDD family membrane protein YckC